MEKCIQKETKNNYRFLYRYNPHKYQSYLYHKKIKLLIISIVYF